VAATARIEAENKANGDGTTEQRMG